MNKKNIIILIALFCFTSVLLIFPLFCNATVDSYSLDQVNDDDLGFEPGNASYGDTFTGPTGTTYVLEPENPTPAQQQALNDAGLNASGAWVPASESSESDKDDWKCLPDGTCKKASSGYSTKSQCEANCEPHGTYKICRKPYTTLFGADANKLYCKPASWSGVRPADQCQKDGDCNGGGNIEPEPEPEPEPEEPTTTTTICYSGWKCSRNVRCSADSEYCKECVYSSCWKSSAYKKKASCEANCQYKCKCEPYREPSIQDPRYSCNSDTHRCELDLSSGIFTSTLQCSLKCRISGMMGFFMPSGYGYSCDLETYQCSSDFVSGGLFSTRAECSRYCQKPPMRYACDTENWVCREDPNGVYSSLSNCQSDCSNKCVCAKCPSSGPCEKECTVNTDCNNGTPPPTTPPTTIPPCVITKFELPKRAWVDIETIAYWSTNDYCDTAEINCISDDCIEGVEDLSGEVPVGFDQKKPFTIYAPGTYRYELKACDPNNCDTYEDVLGTGLKYIEIEVLYLPWWQEIIPVLPDNLQGFLRGLIN